jgi:hypothetical protein
MKLFLPTFLAIVGFLLPHVVTSALVTTHLKNDQEVSVEDLVKTLLGDAASQDFVEAVKLLSESGEIPLDLDTLEWGRKTQDDDDNERLIETSVGFLIPGLDPDELSLEDDAFIEDLLLFTFNQVARKSVLGLRGISSHPISTTKVDIPDDGIVAATNLRSGTETNLGRSKYWKERQSGANKFSGHGSGCRFCPKLLGALDGQLSSILDPELIQLWADKTCNSLVDSGYSVFEAVGDCSITMKNPFEAVSP